jgi:hypothetical protein
MAPSPENLAPAAEKIDRFAFLHGIAESFPPRHKVGGGSVRAVRWLGTALALRVALVSTGPALVARTACGQVKEAPKLVVLGSCPTADAIELALTPLLRRDFAASPGDLSRIEDQGNRFLVSVKGQIAQYSDASRDCAERARVSAVFIALTLSPPQMHGNMAASAEPSPVPRGAARARETTIAEPILARVELRPTSGAWARFELGARFDGALTLDAPSTLAAGVEFRASLGRGRVGAVLGAAVLAPVVWELSGVLVREQRFPGHLALRVRWLSTPAALALDVGLSASAFVLQALDSGAGSSTRLDLGPRAALTAQVETDRGLSPYLGAQFEYFPRSSRLLTEPNGEVGTTPHARFGISLGASLDLDLW